MDDKQQAADKVRAFYDAHPYPPPVEDLDSYRKRWQDESRRRAEYHLHWPNRPYREDLAVLVAGCGTSQAARHALRQPASHVVGIDVGVTSVRHTEALKRKYDLTNLEVRQLPIERVGELERSFDKIVCTGVLHHLPDPDAGLRALREVLEPDGVMQLMVYAEYGRAGVYMLQEYARLLGVGDTDEEINDFANTLMALPREHPLARLLGESPDFRSKAGLADELLHPQDRAYTVPELFEFIDQAGLIFGRWLRQAPYLPQCGDLANTPHSPRLAQLPEAEQYAAVELFRGTMLRHSLVAYRDDTPDGEPGGGQPVRFGGDRWLDYVPLRLPGTISVREKLPPGAAAVLINQAHTYPDLYLPVNTEEENLVEGIDGKRTIAEIVREAAATKGRQLHHEQVRTFFERLWWYDQVVFDASEKISSAASK
ncbi:MAG: class I SAM-dependent methyltransferase [Chloroflexota bacterium]|nr:class I SAM-dependent methyltransferase [Chloroflexota bacterium]